MLSLGTTDVETSLMLVRDRQHRLVDAAARAHLVRAIQGNDTWWPARAVRAIVRTGARTRRRVVDWVAPAGPREVVRG